MPLPSIRPAAATKAKVAINVGQVLLLESTDPDPTVRSKPYPVTIIGIGRIWATLDLHRSGSSPYRLLKNQEVSPGEPLMLNTPARFIPQGRLWLSQEDYDLWPGLAPADDSGSSTPNALASLNEPPLPPPRPEPRKALAAPDVGPLLAWRFRLEREVRGWSLAVVAERSGVSKAMISKIERNQTGATAALLIRLAAAFELNLSDLLIKPEHADRLSRARDQSRWTDPETGLSRTQVLALPGHPILLADYTLPGGAISKLSLTHTASRPAIWLLHGDVTVMDGDEHHHLNAGDCLALNSPHQVQVANESGDPCRFAVLQSPKDQPSSVA